MHAPDTHRSRLCAVIIGCLAAAAIGTVLYAAWLVVRDDPGMKSLATVADVWVYNGVIFLTALAFVARAALRPEGRWAWAAFGTGLAFWAAGDVYWSVVLIDLKPIPYPSWADAGYLLALPCFFVALGLMVRRRIGHFTAASWFDGAIAALAAAACATAVLAPALIGLTKGDPATVVVNLAYPIGDVLLVALIAGALAVGGLRGAGALLLIGVGLVVWATGDVLYLWSQARGETLPAWTDLLWLVGALLMGSSALVSERSANGARRYRSGLLVPALSTAAATTILIADHFHRTAEAAIWLAGLTIIAVSTRLAISFRENDRLVGVLHDESVTDPLTGLANRRALLNDLDRVYAKNGATASRHHVFALFDLDGFKAYNDSFGHPAGDSLLRRLGSSLERTIGDRGGSYRLGGDEFCILARPDGLSEHTLIEMARAALSERGEGFAISASGGSVRVPDDAPDPSEALRIADHRMYVEKAQRSVRSDQQAREVLLRILRERDSDLGSHIDGVARLAREVGRALGFDAEEMDVLSRAAEMHDVGKIAIPDEILEKPGPLDEIEWELMRRHTLIGERILASTPALAPVAHLVRSAHERWDGLGYPDGLSGEAIPLGSRIIFVCDAYDAMRTDRPYQRAAGHDEALAELRRHAGTQFDPDVVEVFCRVCDRAATQAAG